MNIPPLLIIIIIALLSTYCFADPDNIMDTCPTAPTAKQTVFFNSLPCKNPSTVTPSDFKSRALAAAGDTDNFHGSATSVVTAAEYPGLNALGLAAARTDLAQDGMVMPHSHPRAAEMMFVDKGTVVAGFVDTSNRLFQRVVREGGVFVFPKGLLHFSLNVGYEPAVVFSVLNSQNPGLVGIADAMFGSLAGLEMLNNVTMAAIKGHVYET